MISFKLWIAVLSAACLMFPTVTGAQCTRSCGGGVYRTSVTVTPTTVGQGQPVSITISVTSLNSFMATFVATVNINPVSSKCASFAHAFRVSGLVGAGQHRIFTYTLPAPKCNSAYNIALNNGTVRATFTVVSTTPNLAVKVISPATGSTETNPVPIAATASGANPISQIQVWVNFKEVFHVGGGSLNANVALPVGSNERLVVQAVDSKGNTAKVVESITVK